MDMEFIHYKLMKIIIILKKIRKLLVIPNNIQYKVVTYEDWKVLKDDKFL